MKRPKTIDDWVDGIRAFGSSTVDWAKNPGTWGNIAGGTPILALNDVVFFNQAIMESIQSRFQGMGLGIAGIPVFEWLRGYAIQGMNGLSDKLGVESFPGGKYIRRFAEKGVSDVVLPIVFWAPVNLLNYALASVPNDSFDLETALKGTMTAGAVTILNGLISGFYMDAFRNRFGSEPDESKKSWFYKFIERQSESHKNAIVGVMAGISVLALSGVYAGKAAYGK